jgi:hypothetical protein
MRKTTSKVLGKSQYKIKDAELDMLEKESSVLSKISKVQ